MPEIKTIQIVNGLLDMQQAADFLNITKSTLYDMTMRKKIPTVKIGRLNRFLLKDLEAFIQQNRQPATNADTCSLN